MDSIAKRHLDADRLEEVHDAAPCTHWKEHSENAW